MKWKGVHDPTDGDGYMRGWEDVWFEWLEKHETLDLLIQNTWRRPRWALVSSWHAWHARRTWRPGTWYLDHGMTPCLLQRLEDGDTLVGVSLVDGSLKGGCSIYACGPERVTVRDALRVAEVLRTMGRA